MSDRVSTLIEEVLEQRVIEVENLKGFKAKELEGTNNICDCDPDDDDAGGGCTV